MKKWDSMEKCSLATRLVQALPVSFDPSVKQGRYLNLLKRCHDTGLASRTNVTNLGGDLWILNARHLGTCKFLQLDADSDNKFKLFWRVVILTNICLHIDDDLVRSG